MSFPLLPGQRERVRALVRALTNERRDEYERSQRRAGVTREVWFLQETSQGDRAIVYFEARDPVAAIDAMTRSEDPFDLWFKNETWEITGMSFDHPEPWIPFESVMHYGL
jgi:Family of unknown function (DUF6176)